MLLRESRPSRWTVADVPLLDEAAELLGVDDSAAKAARRELERAQRLEAKYAQEVLDVTGIADLGLVDAETLAAWNRDNGPVLSTAERAAADRSWAYGHVIIDEAQELSAMAWRMVLRRNPTRSMTVVGDVAQTGSPGRCPLLEGDADPAGRHPLARGTPHGELPHPGGDHDGGRRRPSLGGTARAPAGVGPLRGRPAARRPIRAARTSRRPSPGSPGPTLAETGRPRRRPPGRDRPRRAASPSSPPRYPRRSPATAPNPWTPPPPCSRSRRPRASSSTG